MTTVKKKNTQDAEINVHGKRLWTIPNILCFIRMFGSFLLLAAAVVDWPRIFFWLFIILALTDWVDGKLAILLNQRSVFGARLDTWADVSLYTALFLGSSIMYWDELNREFMWFVPAVASYSISVLLGLYKFRRWPSYHTKSAKVSWLLITVGAISFLSGWSIWPLRCASIVVTFTNLEAILITLFSREWQADVFSLKSILKTRQKSCRKETGK